MNDFIKFCIVAGLVFLLSSSCAAIYFVRMAKDRKVKNNVENTDPFSRCFVFSVKLSKNDAVSALLVKNANDALRFDFNSRDLTIRFLNDFYNTGSDYLLTFYEFEEKTYLKACRVSSLPEKDSNIAFNINSFFINKLGAEPVNYGQFLKIISE